MQFKTKEEVTQLIDLRLENAKIILADSLEKVELSEANLNGGIEADLKKAISKQRVKQEDYEKEFFKDLNAEIVQLNVFKPMLERSNKLVNRYQAIQNSTVSSECFVISANTTVKELEHLIAVIAKIKKQTSINEHEFLDILLAAAEGQKGYITSPRHNANALHPEVAVPLLRREHSFVVKLLSEINNELTPVDQKALDSITASIKSVNIKDYQLSNQENIFFKSLCNSLLKDIKDYSLHKSPEWFQDNVNFHFNKAITNAERTPINEGWRGIINDLLKFFGSEPYYKVGYDEGTKLADKVNGIKRQLAVIKTSAAVDAASLNDDVELLKNNGI